MISEDFTFCFVIDALCWTDTMENHYFLLVNQPFLWVLSCISWVIFRWFSHFPFGFSMSFSFSYGFFCDFPILLWIFFHMIFLWHSHDSLWRQWLWRRSRGSWRSRNSSMRRHRWALAVGTLLIECWRAWEPQKSMIFLWFLMISCLIDMTWDFLLHHAKQKPTYPPVIKHGNGTWTIYQWFS